MPIIHLTPAEYMQSKTIEAGFYPAEIVKIDGPIKSGSGKSFNTFFDVQITDGPWKNKLLRFAISDGSNGQGNLLGAMMWYPQSQYIPILAALGLDDGQIKELNFELHDLEHKPFDVGVGVETVDGQLINTVTSFNKLGYAASAPAF